jgi:N-acetylglucosaminyl-diphospho-decaprenol L-rhamnosyltransferase
MIIGTGVCLSVVSHGQADLVDRLLRDLSGLSLPNLELVIVTSNIPGSYYHHSHGLNVLELNNRVALGFGENHNQAFCYCKSDFFCVCNPDIRLSENPFPAMLQCFTDPTVGAVVPRVIDSHPLSSNVRKSPTPMSILFRLLGHHNQLEINSRCMDIDWGAGMFQLFSSDAYSELGGFDEDFFLYYEDVDICHRIRTLGRRVVVCPTASVAHEARRDSHKKLVYAFWHVKSMLRFFFKKYILRSYGGGRKET